MSMAVGFDTEPHSAPMNHHAAHEPVVCGQTPERSVSAQAGVRRPVYWPAVDSVQGFALRSGQDCHGGMAFLCWCPVCGLLAAPEPVLGSGADAADAGVLVVLPVTHDDDSGGFQRVQILCRNSTPVQDIRHEIRDFI